ncbi:Non-specific lipid-transfer protein [Vigna angularis]|uniref:Non-specific lipid-transfer protein n=2 Tax=Phaseolus angularis TaxID=3914 RepID=A0A8T0K900_PHAAN|nr:Non-specific lipid-transfer protein [Vigna angularis]
MGKKTFIAYVLFISMMLVESEVHAITCNEAITFLLPCEPFMLGLGPRIPSLSCCTSIAIIFKQTKTPELRRSTCSCLKNAAFQAGIKHERATLLSRLCRTRFSFPIDPLVDCSS